MKELLRLKYDIPENILGEINGNLEEIPIKVSTNEIYSGMNWKKRRIIAEWYHNLTREDCNEIVTIEEKVDIVMRFYFKTYAFDSSNCSFMAKMIEDSLTKNNALKDDTNKEVWKFTVESVFIPEKERKKMEWHYVRIYIYKNSQWKNFSRKY